MHRLRRTALAGLCTLGVLVGPAWAQLPTWDQQVTYHADSAKVAAAAAAGVKLIHWVQTSPAANEHVIYVRNISQQPIQVTSYEIYDCFNLSGRVCGVHAPGPLLAPGQTKRLVIIESGAGVGRSSYQYRIHSAPVTPDSTRADTTHH
jgi:hypothetical protein